MAQRKGGGLKRAMKLEAMSLERPPKAAAKLPGIKAPKAAPKPKIAKPRAPAPRLEKFPKAPPLRAAKRKKKG